EGFQVDPPPLRVPEGKPGRDHRAGGVLVTEQRQRLPVAPQPQAGPARELESEERAEHDSEPRRAPFEEADRDTHDREAAREVGGAVERVHGPHQVGAVAATLLRQHRHAGRVAGEHGEDRLLAGAVGVGDVIVEPLDLGLGSRAGQACLEEHLGAGPGGPEGYLEELVQASSPSPNIDSRSWAENCWKATMVLVLTMPSRAASLPVTTP